MTILFQHQWDEHPSAIIDTKTKNTSFIRLAALYREMGVINHSFPLQLMNPELQGVDPFDPNLSIEQMMMIAIECKSNFFYYIREIARDPNGTAANPLSFRANRGNIALFWLFFNHITTILIQIRQTGKSFSTDTLMTYLLNIRCTNTNINLLTKDDPLRTSNLERLKNIDLELPFYLRQRAKSDISNTEEVSISSLGNRYRGYLPNKSPKLALNVSRGSTSPIIHTDEAALFYNIAITLPAALAAGTAARELAAMKNEPYGNIITTTAGKQDDKDGAYVYNLMTNSAIWSEKFFDARDLEELEKLVRTNSSKGNLRVNCTFNHRQLGYTDEWLKKVLENSEAVGEDADRDFFNRWTSGSNTSPIPAELTNLIRDSQQNDYYNEISSPYTYITRWFLPEANFKSVMLNESSVMSLDTSDAAGGDDIGMNIRRVRTGETIAAGNYNETNLITFCEWLVAVMVKYPKLILIPERRSTGAMILDYLLLMLPAKGIDPFTRIYNKAVQDADEYPERFKEISKPMHYRSNDVYVKYKKLFGFATSATGATSRSELYSTTLLNACKHTGSKVKDPKTIDQILGLIISNGRVDHAPGGNDDMVIAWLLNAWLLLNGKNLHIYGINSRDILADNVVTQEINNPINIYERRLQESIRNQIEELVERIGTERDDFIAMKLEAKLKSLNEKLNTEDKQILSLDDLINTLREKRRANRPHYNTIHR